MVYPDILVNNSYKKDVKCLVCALYFFCVFYSSVSHHQVIITLLLLSASNYSCNSWWIWISLSATWSEKNIHTFLCFQGIVFFYFPLLLALQNVFLLRNKRYLDPKCNIDQSLCVFCFRWLMQRWLDLVWRNKDLTYVYFGKRCVVLLGYYISNYWDYSNLLKSQGSHKISSNASKRLIVCH